mgnify:FL=1
MKRFLATLEEIIDNLISSKQQVDTKEIEKFVEVLLKANKIYTYGAGRSGLIAKAFAQRLMHLGFKSYVIGETINPSVESGDAIVIVSGSGETTSSVCIGKKAKEVGAILVVITAHPESSLGKNADLVVKVPGKTKIIERESLAPFTTLFDITAMAVLDSVASELMEKIGATEETIAKKHANVE